MEPTPLNRKKKRMRRRSETFFGATIVMFAMGLWLACPTAKAACPRLLEVAVNKDQVTLTNLEAGTQPAGYWLCNFPNYQQIAQPIAFGETVVVTLPGGFLTAGDGEVGLYSTNSFGSSTAILDYMEYGSTGHTRSGVAVAGGVWTVGDFVPLPQSGAMEWTGSNCGDPGNAESWQAVVSREAESFATIKALFD
jgi:hypothetical protein